MTDKKCVTPADKKDDKDGKASIKLLVGSHYNLRKIIGQVLETVYKIKVKHCAKNQIKIHFSARPKLKHIQPIIFLDTL